MSTKTQKPFFPTGKSHIIDASVTPAPGVKVSSGKSSGYTQLRVMNTSGVDVWIGFGETSAEAQSNAAAATSGNPSNGVFFPNGLGEVLSFNGDAPIFVSAYAASVVAIVVSSGEGD